MTATALDVLHVAQQQVGFVEGANNANPYGDWYGLPNEPYCAMGVSWCFEQVGLSHLVAAQTAKGFAYCPAGLAWFQRKGAVVGKYDGQPGDIVFFSWSGNGIADHVEIVVAASKDGITTVGFNTGPEHTVTNQANGDGCYLRHRAYLSVLAIARPEYATPLKPAVSPGTNKLVAAGVAATAALGGGGVAISHTSSGTPTVPATTFVAPPFVAVTNGSRSAVALIVEKALFKAGLIAATNKNSAWSVVDVKAVNVYQKAHKLPVKALDKTTYTMLMKTLP